LESLKMIRARVKALEDMPPGVPCCQKMALRLTAFKGTVNVTPAALKKSRCQDCGAPFKGMRVQGLRGWRIDPRAWEIEEGSAVC
jgi:hypothetical protein